MLAVGILGGGFEVKEIKISSTSTPFRILAGVVGLVFMAIGLGLWQPNAQTETGPATTTAKMSEREHDKDRLGGGYTGFDVNTDHIEDCETACKGDAKCVAWTYVKPGIQGPHARCWLKSVVPAISDNPCCVSGTKLAGK